MNEERTGKWLRQSIGTYPWSFVTQIFRSCKLNHGADRKTFEVMTTLSFLLPDNDHITCITYYCH